METKILPLNPARSDDIVVKFELTLSGGKIETITLKNQFSLLNATAPSHEFEALRCFSELFQMLIARPCELEARVLLEKFRGPLKKAAPPSALSDLRFPSGTFDSEPFQEMFGKKAA